MGIKVVNGWGPKCFPIFFDALIPVKIAVCPVPLCGSPSTPRVVFTGVVVATEEITLLFLREGIDPPNSVVKVGSFAEKNGFEDASSLPYPTPSQKIISTAIPYTLLSTDNVTGPSLTNSISIIARNTPVAT